MTRNVGPEMMKREDLYYLRQEALDLMSWILVHAPDEWPEDTNTDVTQEFDKLREALARCEGSVKTEDQKQLFQLCLSEVQSSHEAFLAQNEHKGCRDIQNAEEHFRRSFKQAKIRPSFIVADDGKATKT